MLKSNVTEQKQTVIQFTSDRRDCESKALDSLFAVAFGVFVPSN